VVLPPTSAISPAKLAANVANAQLSTGAITPEGKAIISQNATRHGLSGKFRVLSGESQEDFDQLLAGLIRSEEPADEAEITMVHQMAEALWLSRRSVRLQNECFADIDSGTEEQRRVAHKTLALYLRYQTTHDRTFQRYATELRKRRNERRKVERGFVSQKYREAAEQRREANENRKKELHELRQQMQILRQQRVEINNRIAAAKAERLESQNQGKEAPQAMPAAA
jgi:hypothetical protein